MAKYAVQGHTASVGLRNLEQSPDVLEWIESEESRLLWIDGHKEVSHFDWTSNFSLEVTSRADQMTDVTSLSHFCSEPNGSGDPKLLLQSLIIQLIHDHRSAFSSNICHKKRLNRGRFEQARKSFADLWAIFADCLSASQPKCLYLVLDNLDSLHSSCREGERLDEFNLLLRLLEGLAKAATPVSKILVTCRLPGVSQALFSDQSLVASSTRYQLVKIPRAERLGASRLKRHKRRYRAESPKPNPVSSSEAQALFEKVQSATWDNSDDEGLEQLRRSLESTKVDDDSDSDYDVDTFTFKTTHSDFHRLMALAKGEIDESSAESDAGNDDDLEDDDSDDSDDLISQFMDDYKQKQRQKTIYDMEKLVDIDRD